MNYKLDSDAHTQIIKNCPYCGKTNFIQGTYATGDTKVIIYCIYCGAEL